VEGDWKRLHSEKNHNLYALPNVIHVIKSRGMRWVGHIACMKDEKCIQNFCWKPEEKRPPRRPRHKWKDSIKMDLREIGWEDMD
jgi:hypothetical protein